MVRVADAVVTDINWRYTNQPTIDIKLIQDKPRLHVMLRNHFHSLFFIRIINFKLLSAIFSFTVLGLATTASVAAVLPEDRADILYHSYEGGGVEITGPSILVRKQLDDRYSFYGNYYVDTISSASIDVVATASPYNEERTEYKVGMDYLRDKVTLSTSYTFSEENDFTAQSMHFDVSQEIFGGLTTVSLGYSYGWDEVGKSTDASFSKDVDRHNYRLNVSQVITKNLILEAGVETISDEGFLNNPYRQVRYFDATAARGFSYEPEVYPNTRTSTAVAFRAKYYLPYRAAVHYQYRFFDDTWGINGKTVEIGYTHPFKDRWIFDITLRGYDQTAADFYKDIFSGPGAQNFLARDKELSTFTTVSAGFGVSYKFTKGSWGFIDRGTFNFSYTNMSFEYDDFRNVLGGGAPGAEPLYNFEADVVQLYLSLWY